MKFELHEWQRLIEAARRAPDQADPKAPYGFATRVAAQAAAIQPVSAATWICERLSLRALGVAALVAVVAVATSISPIQQMIEDEAMALQQDPVSDLTELS